MQCEHCITTASLCHRWQTDVRATLHLAGLASMLESVWQQWNRSFHLVFWGKVRTQDGCAEAQARALVGTSISICGKVFYFMDENAKPPPGWGAPPEACSLQHAAPSSCSLFGCSNPEMSVEGIQNLILSHIPPTGCRHPDSTSNHLFKPRQPGLSPLVPRQRVTLDAEELAAYKQQLEQELRDVEDNLEEQDRFSVPSMVGEEYKIAVLKSKIVEVQQQQRSGTATQPPGVIHLGRVSQVSKAMNEAASRDVLWDPHLCDLLPSCATEGCGFAPRTLSLFCCHKCKHGQGHGKKCFNSPRLRPDHQSANEAYQGEEWKIQRRKAEELHRQRMQQRMRMRCGVHMFHPVNGRRGFELLDPPDWMHNAKPPRTIMAKLLQEEDEMRLSDEVQALYADAGNDTLTVGAIVQDRVAAQFLQHCEGSASLEDLVQMMRCAPRLYPEAPEMRTIPHYQKFNLASRGVLNIGDKAPDAQLVTLTEQPVSLSKLITQEQTPLVICVGSYS